MNGDDVFLYFNDIHAYRHAHANEGAHFGDHDGGHRNYALNHENESLLHGAL